MANERSSPYLDPMSLPTVRSFLSRLQPGSANIDADVTVWDYLNLASSVEMAYAYSRLYWPDFVLYRGVVLLREASGSVGFEGALANGLAPVEAQRSANHTLVWDLFANGSDNADAGVFEELAAVLGSCWLQKAMMEFPSVGIQVEVFEDSCGPAIELWQLHSLPSGPAEESLPGS